MGKGWGNGQEQQMGTYLSILLGSGPFFSC